MFLSPSFFVIAWAFVGFFLLRVLSGRYFHEQGRATVASAAVAVTFLVTALSNDTSTPVVPVSGSVSATAPLAAHGANAGCADVKGPFAPGAAGSVDVARTPEKVLHDGDSLDRGDKLILGGWAADKSKSSVARAVCMTIDGQTDSTASSSYGTPRADVASAFGNQRLTQTGFSLELPSGAGPTGTHAFGVVVESADGTWLKMPHVFSLTRN